MKRLSLLVFVVLVWAFTTINTSGWGIAHNTENITVFVIIGWFLITQGKSQTKLPIGGSNQFLSLFTFLSFILLPLFSQGSWEGATYLSMILLVYCFSQQNVTDRFIVFSGYIMALLGLGVLFVYTRTELLSGWNENQIGMIGFYCYMYYLISMSGKMSFKKATIGIAITVVYTSLLFLTKSRSVLLFIIIAIFVFYFESGIKSFFRSKSSLFWALSVPLIVAVVVVLFPKASFFDIITDLSSRFLDKSESTNGRAEIWSQAFRHLSETSFLGCGVFEINYHNSAVAVLDVFGIIGYICWFKLFKKPLSHMRDFFFDDIVFGCVMAFLIIFWQQSFELGFVEPYPNMIPYMILGIGLGRVKTIRENC